MSSVNIKNSIGDVSINENNSISLTDPGDYTSWTVTFTGLAGATPSSLSLTVYSHSPIIYEPQVSKIGYKNPVFKIGTNTVTFPYTVTGNTTINITWSEDLVYATMVGSTTQIISLKRGLDNFSPSLITTTPPVRTGYTFSYWTPNIPPKLEEDTTFKPFYEPIEYTVRAYQGPSSSYTYNDYTVKYGEYFTIPDFTPPAGKAYLYWSVGGVTYKKGSFLLNLRSTPGTVSIYANLEDSGSQFYRTSSISNLPVGDSLEVIRTANFSTTVCNPLSTQEIQNLLNLASATPSETPFGDYYRIDQYVNCPGGNAICENMGDGDSIHLCNGSTYMISAKPNVTVSFSTTADSSPSSYSSQSITPHFQRVTSPGTPTRVTHDFNGWSPSLPRYVTGNTTFVAQWSAKPQYTVTFNYKTANGTDTSSSVVVYRGQNATAPSVPARTYWNFSGWSGVFTNVQSNLTINAVYVPTASGYYISPTSTMNLEYGAMQTFSVAKRETTLPNPSSYSWLSGGDLSLATITGDATSAFKITNSNTSTSEGYIGSISVSINVSGLIFSLSFSGVVNLLRQRFTITTNASFTGNSALNYTISTQQVFRGVTPVIPEPSVQYWYNSYTDSPSPATQNKTYYVYYAVDPQQFDSPLITSSENPTGTAKFTIQNTNQTRVSVSYTIYRLVNYQRYSTVKSGTFNLASSSSTTISHVQNTNTYLEIEVEFKYSGVSVGSGTRTQWVQQPAAVKKWQYITYVSSEPEYGTYNFAVYRTGATTQTQAKSILDAEFPASGYGIGTVGVITPDYNIFWIFEVIQ